MVFGRKVLRLKFTVIQDCETVCVQGCQRCVYKSVNIACVQQCQHCVCVQGCQHCVFTTVSKQRVYKNVKTV